MNKKSLLMCSMAIGAFMVFSHMGDNNTSTNGRALPAVNFYGVLKDTSDNTYNVEYVTIDHLYTHIPVYEIPHQAQVDPAVNTTLLDLAEVSSIKVNNPEKIEIFNSRPYCVITVTMNGDTHTTHDYLIGKTKEVFCSQKDAAGDIEKKLSFQAIVTLEIKGHKKSEDSETKSDTKK